MVLWARNLGSEKIALMVTNTPLELDVSHFLLLVVVLISFSDKHRNVSLHQVGLMKKKKVYIPVHEHPDINFLGKFYINCVIVLLIIPADEKSSCC